MKKPDVRRFWENYSTMLMVAVLLLFFNIFQDEIWSPGDYMTMLLGSTGLMMCVVGLSFVMTTGSIDFSIGYQISLLSVLIAKLTGAGISGATIIVMILAAGVLCSLLNGILVGYLGIVPFAATIASQVIFRGVSYALSDERMSSYMAESIRSLTRNCFLGIRLDLWMAFAAFLLLFFIMHKTILGVHLRAIGLDEAAAVRSGVNVRKEKCLAYCVSGLFYAMAAMVLSSRTGYAGSEVGEGMEITAMVAAYVGGILTFARRKNVLNLFLGILVVSMIETGLKSLGISTYVQYVLTGLILIISMVLHQRQLRPDNDPLRRWEREKTVSG